MGRIVVFGATGYTGRLTVAALVRRGQRPVLAGRSADRLARLTAQLGGELDVAVADVAQPESVRDLVRAGDVLVSTVGPFARWGDAAVRASVASGAHYLDVAAEPAFVRRVFEHHAPAAAAAGVGLVPAFGWESVPGNLAGALALREAGEAAVRVDTGYFYRAPAGFSGGSRASFLEAIASPSFAFRDGSVRTVRTAERFRKLPLAGRARPAVSLGAAEHYALPRSFPRLEEVNVYLADLGRLSRPAHALARAGDLAFRLRGVRGAYGAAVRRLVRGSTGGPDAGARARGETHVVGLAYDAGGRRLSEVHLAGGDGYDLTAELLAWGAERAAGGLPGAGALGPVEAFAVDELVAGCAAAGMARVAG